MLHLHAAAIRTRSGRELEGLRSDGSTFLMELAITEVQLESRRLFTGLVRDISERIQTEDRLLEAARLSSIGELAAGVAHEINNPLTSILGFSHLLLNTDPPESIKTDLQTVYSEAQRAAHIVQDLLIFARRSGPHEVRINMNSVLTKALNLKSYDFKTDGIEFSQYLAENIPDTMLDEHQMIQVVVNILTNAQQAIKSASRTGKISICSSRSSGKFRVSISYSPEKGKIRSAGDGLDSDEGNQSGKQRGGARLADEGEGISLPWTETSGFPAEDND